MLEALARAFAGSPRFEQSVTASPVMYAESDARLLHARTAVNPLRATPPPGIPAGSPFVQHVNARYQAGDNDATG